MSKIIIMFELYGFRTPCGIKRSFSIAEILMPKFEEHASIQIFNLLDEKLSGKSDEFLST